MNLKKTISKAYSNLYWYRYHNVHAKYASSALKSIEKEKGKTDPILIKKSDEYAKNVLGWKGFSPWLYVYSAIAEDFKDGWLPDNYYGKVIVPKYKGKYGSISDLKPLSGVIFKNTIFPDVLYYVNSNFYTSHLELIPKSKVKGYIFRATEKTVFKLDSSIQGRGVFIFNENNFDLNKICELGNGVFQSFINQNPFFDQFTEKSVATIRITTVIENNGQVTMRAGYLRLGRLNDTHVQSRSHIRIPFNITNGLLDKKGYLPDWQSIDEHPDSKVSFESKKIPQFDRCKEAVLSLHEQIPFVRSIGWDAIVDIEDNVKIMEWNGFHNDIKFSEATQGPCFLGLGWEKP